MKKITEEEIDSMVDLFNKGKFPVEISKIIGRGKTSVLRHLKNRGIVVDRSCSRAIYSIDTEYFDYIDSEDKSYFLGILMADGSNIVSKNTVKLCLKKEDENILFKLNALLKSSRPITEYIDKRMNRSITSELKIFNKHISEKLKSHGMTANKTFTTEFPDCISKRFTSDFIRGYFDGDGSIFSSTNNKNHTKDCATFTGTKEILKVIEKELNKININCSWSTRHPERNHNIRTISISGRLNCIKLMNFMYKNNTNLYMERKYNRFCKIRDRYASK